VRETFITASCAVLVALTSWGWGGVVLWVQWLVSAIGLLAFAVAVLPAPRSGELYGRFLPRALGLSFGLGFLVAAGFIWSDLSLLLTQRDGFRQLFPAAEPEPLRFSQWGLRGLLAGLFTSLVSLIATGFLRPSEPRHRLLRFPPFWLGLFLFAWIACQSWNTWGVVVQRDLFWRILPRDFITWLPSGLDAPFSSDEEPGGMNGWRQFLILLGPWALLCALYTSAPSRRFFLWISVAIGINALALSIVGMVARAEKWRDFLGYSAGDAAARPWGPFVYKNHAGCYLYLCAGIIFALMFRLAVARQDKVDRGGPHLLAFLLGTLVVFGCLSTLSVGAISISVILMAFGLPLAYLMDSKLRFHFSPAPVLSMLALVSVIGYAALFTSDARRLRDKMEFKLERAEVMGIDDRAPIRRATWESITSPQLSRQISGWGAGSFRWISPSFMAKQPEFLGKKGNLNRRATHAHNDWLQAVSEWGWSGIILCLSVIGIVVVNFRKACAAKSSAALLLWFTLTLFLLHAFMDFLLFPPHLVLLSVIYVWMLRLSEKQNVNEPGARASANSARI